jgi:hypothetical protein
VAAAIEAALRIVEEAGVPDDLRGLAFEKAYDALTGSNAPAQAPTDTGVGIAADSRAGRDEVGQVASRLRIDPGSVQRVVDFDDDGVHVIVPRSRLAKQKSTAIQQVATLVVAARQAVGREEWTPQSIVREETEALGVDDRSNFATHIRHAQGIRVRGSGRTGEIKMNAVGFEAAAELIKQLSQEVSR